jgi:hypothetical protein
MRVVWVTIIPTACTYFASHPSSFGFCWFGDIRIQGIIFFQEIPKDSMELEGAIVYWLYGTPPSNEVTGSERVSVLEGEIGSDCQGEIGLWLHTGDREHVGDLRCQMW